MNVMWGIMGTMPDGETSLVLTPNDAMGQVRGRRIYSPVISKDRAQVEETLARMLATPDGSALNPFLAEISWRPV